MPRGSRLKQIVSALFVRVSSLRARDLEGEGCACVANGCDGIRGVDVASWRSYVAKRQLYEGEVCAVLGWLRWCCLGLARL